MPNDIEVRGLSELADALDQLPSQLRQKALRPALKVAGESIAEEARRRAPKKSGELRDKIRTTVKVDPSSNSGFDNYVAIRSTSRKSHLVEFSTAAHKIIGKLKYTVMKLTKPDGKKRRWRRVGITGERNVLASKNKVYGKSVKHPGTEAKPFMRPAFDAKASEAIEKFKTSLRESIIRTVKSAAKKLK